MLIPIDKATRMPIGIPFHGVIAIASLPVHWQDQFINQRNG